MIFSPFRKYTHLFFLITWFVVWGICPWNNASASAHAGPRHPFGHPVSDSHHSSKGADHSCTGSIIFSKSDLQKAGFTYYETGMIDLILTLDQTLWAHRWVARPSWMVHTASLPKLLSRFYQLYSVYRI